MAIGQSKPNPNPGTKTGPKYAWEKNKEEQAQAQVVETKGIIKTDDQVQDERAALTNQQVESPAAVLAPAEPWTPERKPTIDPPYGQAPVPEDVSQHVRHGDAQPVIVPQHILDAEDEDIIEHLIIDGEGIMVELTGSAMHDRLQNLASHFRHVLASARERFLQPPEVQSEVPDDQAQERPNTSVPVVVASIVMFMIMLLSGLKVEAQQVGQVQPQNGAQQTTVGAGNAGVLTNPSTLNVAVSPGPIYCSGGVGYIHNTQFTLTANTGPWTVFYRCSQDSVGITLDNPATSDITLGTVTCGATLCNTLVDVRSAFKFPNVSDMVIPFGPGDCAWNATGTLGATTGLNLQALGASFAPVNSISTTAAGATVDNLTCNIHVPQRTTAGKGIMLLDCTVYYGVQTTALTSMGAPTLSTITMPAAGTAETPSTVTPVSLGAVTVTPVVGSANLGTTTAGAFFTEKVALNTPVFLNTDLQSIIYNQTFNQAAAAAQLVNTPGGVCHAVTVPL